MHLRKPSTKWNLNDWLHYLEQKSPAKIELNLDKILKVAQDLELSSPKCTVITVAGTNGKGSTVHALERIYHAAGYTVGSYTSPHLVFFNERIKVNLVPITDHALCEAFFAIKSGCHGVELSFFEMATLAALWHFNQQHLDILLLEVGLGGRLDATNIVDSDLAIITTIDYDHQEYLGTTLDAIGYEKAGILRPNKPFIYADSDCPKSILQVAEQRNAPTYRYLKEFSFKEHNDLWDFNSGQARTIAGLNKPLIQLKSASAAIMATYLLQDQLPVPISCVYQAMNTIFIPGRLQLQASVKEGVQVLYDVSHNPQSAQLLAKTVQTIKKNKVHAVFSILRDKDILGLFAAVKKDIDYWYIAQLDCSRAASAGYLLAQCKKAEILAETCYTNPFLAFEEALTRAETGDLIVVFGSFSTVGHVIASQQALLEQKGIL